MFVFPYVKNADGQTHTLAVKEVIWTNPDATSSLKKKNQFFLMSCAFMKQLLIIVINTVDMHPFPRTAHIQVAL